MFEGFAHANPSLFVCVQIEVIGKDNLCSIFSFALVEAMAKSYTFVIERKESVSCWWCWMKCNAIHLAWLGLVWYVFQFQMIIITGCLLFFPFLRCEHWKSMHRTFFSTRQCFISAIKFIHIESWFFLPSILCSTCIWCVAPTNNVTCEFVLWFFSTKKKIGFLAGIDFSALQFCFQYINVSSFKKSTIQKRFIPYTDSLVSCNSIIKLISLAKVWNCQFRWLSLISSFWLHLWVLIRTKCLEYM